ncbi:MAG: GLUG motif-containing protein [archaeon]|jgi:hypothetical protein
MVNRAQALYQGQGTIEYLVILAIIVVISLVVVGLTTNMVGSPSTQISSTNDKIGNLTSGGISVVEAVTDSAGDSIVRFQNNSGENITLTKIVSGGIENDYSQSILQGEKISIGVDSLNLNCPCTTGQEKVSCDYTLTFISSSGLTKTITRTTQVDCVNDVNSNATVIPPTTTISNSNCWNESVSPHQICTLSDLNRVREHLDWSYELKTDINAYPTSTWNNEYGFEPIGRPAHCADPRCTDQTSCERELGCDSTWNLTSGCSFEREDLCYYDQGFCENECGGTWDDYEWTCNGVTSELSCDYNSDLCESSPFCGEIPFGGTFTQGVWNEANTCSSTACSTQLTCEQTLGCATTWISDSPFIGNFDGKNKTISGLNINFPVSEVGLFGKISLASTSLSNIIVEDASVTGSNYLIGGLVGNQLNGTISNSSYNGNVGGGGSSGGLVGWQQGGIISGSHASGNVSASLGSNMGGLVGYQSGGVISNSYSTSTVSGTHFLGGLVGYQGGSIFSSYATGRVAGGFSYQVGGLVGGQDGPISNSYARGNVWGLDMIGGLVGNQNSSITGSYSTGSVNGSLEIGGLVGEQNSSITNSFSTGSVTGDEGYSGGLVGYLSGSISSSYWDVVLSNRSNCYPDGNTGCTATNNLVTAYYGSNGVTKLGNDGNWVAQENNYPILSWQ